VVIESGQCFLVLGKVLLGKVFSIVLFMFLDETITIIDNSKRCKMQNTSFIHYLFPLHQFSFYQNAKRKYGFDFDKDWEWDQLFAIANTKETIEDLQKLKEKLSIKNARFILYQLSRLTHPRDIITLGKIEKNQSEWGGGFYGIIPSYFNNIDGIPQPNNFSNIIKTALYLTKVRIQNYKTIANSDFDYPIEFLNNNLSNLALDKISSNLHLDLDFSVIKDLLRFFNKNKITFEEAQRLSSNKIFSEMLRHRIELGYIPRPLPDSTDLARFIFKAASKEPLDEIWKWLNPWNDFCLSDLYSLKDKYQTLVNTLEENKQNIINHILSRISLFLPDDTYFSDRLSFAVNWGIRSWATENTLGTNIVQFKDNYEKMFQTLTHETFHRVQLKLCYADSSRNKKRSFEDLVYHNFQTKENQIFYETLSYIMLEGTATFVGGIDGELKLHEKMLNGKHLLEKIVHEIYNKHNFENIEKLINKGLKSNGPFYALGYFMSKTIVRKLGEKAIGHFLKRGCIIFFEEYIKILDKKTNSKKLNFNSNIIQKINKLKIAF